MYFVFLFSLPPKSEPKVLNEANSRLRTPMTPRLKFHKFENIFTSPYLPDRLWGVIPASYSMGNDGSFPGGKAARAKTDHSSATNAEVKKTWICTTTPSYVFMA
jgi:hypothetical protein